MSTVDVLSDLESDGISVSGDQTLRRRVSRAQRAVIALRMLAADAKSWGDTDQVDALERAASKLRTELTAQIRTAHEKGP
jgi:hypothetical protein